MSTKEELKIIAEAKWQAFYSLATAAGVWFIAFAVSLGLAKWSNGSGLAAIMCGASCSLAIIMGLLMIGSMIEAQNANRAITAADAVKADN